MLSVPMRGKLEAAEVAPRSLALAVHIRTLNLLSHSLESPLFPRQLHGLLASSSQEAT